MKYPALIVGWQEWVALPDLGVPAIRAKVDTGARTSSIHAYRIEHFERDGVPFVRFEVHPIQRNKRIVRICEAPLVDTRIVKSSRGEREERPVIRTRVTLGHQHWDIDLNLTNRDSMGFRMLLGREALARRVLVNPSVTSLHRRLTTSKIKQIYV